MPSAIVLVFVALCCYSAHCESFPSKAYGYVTINQTHGSAMFYALLGEEDVSPKVRGSRPLVLYLQGGPGASSLFGAYLENGPQKLAADGPSNWTLSPRVHTWTSHANMLYVDNPVGTGFSYTNHSAGFSTTDEEIATNLVTFMKGFFLARPEYKASDLWIFCESYGGKMTAYFGAALLKAISAGHIQAKFKGVALGDGWVDPVGCMYSYGPYLKAFSQLTDAEVDNVTQMAGFAQNALEENRGEDATVWWGMQQDTIGMYTSSINWYNSLYYYDYTAESQFETFAGTTLQASLGSLIPSNVNYGSQSNTVFAKMQGAFMRDGILQVEELLNGGVQVHVYGGQVDLIVDTICIQGWIGKLNWAGLESFMNAQRVPFQEPSKLNVAGFTQAYANFAFWQINKAGHMVPLDQPWAAEYMFAKIIGSNAPIPPSAPGEPSADDKITTIHHRRAKP